MKSHPALQPGRTAVITGAASGIGLAAAKRLAGLGMKLCLADLPGDALERAVAEVVRIAANGAASVRAVATDVSRLEEVQRLADHVDVLPSDRLGVVRPQAGEEHEQLEIAPDWVA